MMGCSCSSEVGPVLICQGANDDFSTKAEAGTNAGKETKVCSRGTDGTKSKPTTGNQTGGCCGCLGTKHTTEEVGSEPKIGSMASRRFPPAVMLQIDQELVVHRNQG